MYKIILAVISALLITSASLNAETTVVRNDKTFTTEKTVSSSKDIKTDYTYKDSKGIEYPIYLHKCVKGENAGKYMAYVIKTSAKTGNDYKSWLSNEIADTICKEMKIEQ